ncbi:MAG: DUF2203 domain-containing protein [Gemmatimonadales bacterium]|nr:DUF2203 domain-containing protein [Gemmatimonadales bacterium]
MPEIRIFTVDEAERTLPLLRRILSDLRVEYDVWREALASYEVLAAGTRVETGESEALISARTAVTTAADRINGFLLELEAIGCQFKGFEEGLVDFYALRDDRLVYLCWRLGEEHITHWHEVDAGFAGRQPIDLTEFSAIVP